MSATPGGAGHAAGATGPRALRAGRVAVLGAVAALLALFVVGLALLAYHGSDRPDLFMAEGWSPSEVRAVLAGWAVPVNWLVGFRVMLELLVVGASVVAGYFILRGALSWFRLYLTFVLILHATAGGAVLPAVGVLYPQLDGPGALLQGLAWFALFPLAYVFPDGRFAPRWSRWLLPAWAALFIVLMLGPPEPPESPLVVGVFLGLLATCVGAQVHRYARVSGPVERQQTKWVVVAVALRFGYMVAITATPLGAIMREPSPRGMTVDVATSLVSYVIAALLPAAVAVAIVRYRLFDIDVWISRALVYSVLTALVVATYAAVVGGVGLLWPGGGNLALPLLATGVVAVAFSPARERVQRAVNRLVYGRRDEPYAVVSQLGRQLESAVPPDAVLQTIVDTVGQELKLRYARATLAGPSGGRAVYPNPPPDSPPVDTERFPLRYHDEDLGTLDVAARTGDRLTDADRTLLAEISRQAGVAVRAAMLTADLRHSRERAVVAREEERRRLHRDLHDGLGPTMASLYQRVDAARGLMARNPAAAERLLVDVGEQVRAALGDIRQLVYALRPPALDELGLVAAIEEACRQLTTDLGRLAIDVRATSLPPLPAVVEVVAYRIAIESVTNLVRHAGALSGDVTIAVLDGTAELTVEVADDGCGLGAEARPGVGLRSMRDRAEEIGGSLTVAANHPHGTIVRAHLPLAVDTYDRHP